MWSFLSVLAICLTLLVCAWRAEPFIRRGMTLRERLAYGGEAPAPVVEPEPMPSDLLALVMNESETWARESMHRLIMERYEKTRDWDKVRTALAIQLRADNQYLT